MSQGHLHTVWPGLFLAGLLLLASAPLRADHDAGSQAPNGEINGATVVDATGLIGLADQHPELVIIDARIPTDRRYGYIEGSINLPDVDTDCDRLAGILPNKQSPALFYCNGPKCHRSGRAIGIALECGYQQLFWYRGGIEAWTSEGFPVIRN